MARKVRSNNTESTVESVESESVSAVPSTDESANAIVDSSVPFSTEDDSVLTYESAAALLGVNAAYMRSIAKKSGNLVIERRAIPGTNYKVLVVTRESLEAYMAGRGVKRGRKSGQRMYYAGPLTADQAVVLADIARTMIADLNPDFKIEYRVAKKSETTATAESVATHETEDNAADLIAEMNAADNEHEHEA